MYQMHWILLNLKTKIALQKTLMTLELKRKPTGQSQKKLRMVPRFPQYSGYLVINLMLISW